MDVEDWGKSVPQRILSAECFLSGRAFSNIELTREIYGVNDPTRAMRNKVTHALQSLSDTDKVHRVGDGRYQRPRRHWIHRQRLAMPVT